jgi:hypothetical protein
MVNHEKHERSKNQGEILRYAQNDKLNTRKMVRSKSDHTLRRNGRDVTKDEVN